MYETEKLVIYEQKDFEKDVEKLIKIMIDINGPLPFFCHFDGIYGIPAGGLILAVYLHHRLDLPLLLAPTKNSLVVDDIVDNGLSMSHYITKGNFTVSLFYRENGIWKPDIWLHKKIDKWVHFPWEAPEDGDDRLAR